MGIFYHTNARTNIHIRQQIKESIYSCKDIAKLFNINRSTVIKWQGREDLKDRSCRPKKLNTVLTELDEYIICEVRKTTHFSIDDMAEILKNFIKQVNRDNIYKCLKRNNLSSLKELKVPIKEVNKKFKTYEPGYIHIDIKELPKLPEEKKKKYLFVAIDRATRLVFISIKDTKEAENSSQFFEELRVFFPFHINKILTDNGGEFTDKFANKKRNEPSGDHLFDKKCKECNIEHRLTKPFTPKTNGMVERYNGRVEEILKRHHFENYEILEKTLKGHLNCYNHFIKQRALNYRTPSDMVKSWYVEKKEIFKDNFNIKYYNIWQLDM